MEFLVKFKVAVCKFIRKSKEWIFLKATKFQMLVLCLIIHVFMATIEIFS